MIDYTSTPEYKASQLLDHGLQRLDPDMFAQGDTPLDPTEIISDHAGQYARLRSGHVVGDANIQNVVWAAWLEKRGPLARTSAYVARPFVFTDESETTKDLSADGERLERMQVDYLVRRMTEGPEADRVTILGVAEGSQRLYMKVMAHATFKEHGILGLLAGTKYEDANRAHHYNRLMILYNSGVWTPSATSGFRWYAPVKADRTEAHYGLIARFTCIATPTFAIDFCPIHFPWCVRDEDAGIGGPGGNGGQLCVQVFTAALRTVLLRLGGDKCPLILGGDFNCDVHEDQTIANAFSEDLGLVPVAHHAPGPVEPTHWTPNLTRGRGEGPAIYDWIYHTRGPSTRRDDGDDDFDVPTPYLQRCGFDELDIADRSLIRLLMGETTL